MDQPNILIVEDHLDLARAMTALLRKAGFSVSYATDTLKASQAMNLVIPAMMILDVNIPKSGGLDFLQAMRVHDKLSNVPVVIYTAIDDPQLRERARKLGAVDYVVKGALDGASIARLVRKHIRPSSTGATLLGSPIELGAGTTLPQ
ncbi:response regulator [Humisphaera borealis]|uniref:Response regulator n=1 Tax=Humisphaera borealis TaxID=2807512 RepID=A0A7M2X1R4_9BACT|nr:response regulator [Humisphaera borealis]QOV91643.1 response regulator [Humisphaera borealis]